MHLNSCTLLSAVQSSLAGIGNAHQNTTHAVWYIYTSVYMYMQDKGVYIAQGSLVWL